MHIVLSSMDAADRRGPLYLLRISIVPAIIVYDRIVARGLHDGALAALHVGALSRRLVPRVDDGAEQQAMHRGRCLVRLLAALGVLV